MSQQVHALHLTVIRWEPDQTAEDYVTELEGFGISAWVYNDTAVQFAWSDVETVNPGGATFVFGPDREHLFTVHPSRLDELLQSEDAS